MLFLTFFVALIPATLCVRCFTCSWSPKDAPNRTVMCSDERFESNALAISDCPHGCQTYMHMDSNGAVEQVRRSCLQEDGEMTGGCVSDENKAFSSRRCTCNHNLCNTATTPLHSMGAMLLLAALVSLLRLGRD